MKDSQSNQSQSLILDPAQLNTQPGPQQQLSKPEKRPQESNLTINSSTDPKQSESAKSDLTQEKEELKRTFETLDEAMDYTAGCVERILGVKIHPDMDGQKMLYIISLAFHAMDQAVQAAGMKWEKQKKKKLW